MDDLVRRTIRLIEEIVASVMVVGQIALMGRIDMDHAGLAGVQALRNDPVPATACHKQ